MVGASARSPALYPIGWDIAEHLERGLVRVERLTDHGAIDGDPQPRRQPGRPGGGGTHPGGGSDVGAAAEPRPGEMVQGRVEVTDGDDEVRLLADTLGPGEMLGADHEIAG